MGAEETFGVDHRDLAVLHATLQAQAERVARELRAEGYAGRSVTLKLRFADFSTITRSHTTDPTQDGLRIYREARALLDRVRLAQPVRLIGLSVSGLGPAAQGQLPLLDTNAVRREGLARALDRLAGRFGDAAVQPASLLGRPRGRRRVHDDGGSPPPAS
jgi:DNA polymerase-4